MMYIHRNQWHFCFPKIDQRVFRRLQVRVNFLATNGESNPFFVSLSRYIGSWNHFTYTIPFGPTRLPLTIAKV